LEAKKKMSKLERLAAAGFDTAKLRVEETTMLEKLSDDEIEAIAGARLRMNGQVHARESGLSIF
jgi:hypothetical protein